MRTLIFHNINFLATHFDVANFLKTQGFDVSSYYVGLFKNKTGKFAGKHTGSGFVKFRTDEDAAEAVERMNGALFMDRKLSVDFSRYEGFGED